MWTNPNCGRPDCHLGFPHRHTTDTTAGWVPVNDSGEWGYSGPPIDTGAIHRAPLERRIAELEAEAAEDDKAIQLLTQQVEDLTVDLVREREGRERAEGALREAVEAAYREGWDTSCPIQTQADGDTLQTDWLASEACARLLKGGG